MGAIVQSDGARPEEINPLIFLSFFSRMLRLREIFASAIISFFSLKNRNIEFVLTNHPWTPELLAEAISQIDSNRIGVDLRTVQLWFQENDKGISTANIRWLARIFGCDDPAATREWQIELSAAQSRLTAKRRDSKKAMPPPVTVDDQTHPAGDLPQGIDATRRRQGFSLARTSEALFSHACYGCAVRRQGHL